MKYFVSLVLIFLSLASSSQKLKKSEKIVFTALQQHINYLADDKLEGRRTGTNGEKLAAEYIIGQFKAAGLQPKGENNNYIQEFEVLDGRTINPSTHLLVNGEELKTERDYFPLVYSANASIEAAVSPALQENNSPWFWDIRELLEENKNNPHFDLSKALYDKTEAVAKQGATALFIYNSSATEDGIKYNKKDKAAVVSIPVVYIQRDVVKKVMPDEAATYDIKLKVDISEKKRTGNNVIGYVDNGAATTVVIGAHYDHLGYGEDGNSRNTGPAGIHNGADDNASGTAALLELARMIPASKLKNNNYLFIAFSGEELGLYGSKHFTDHPTIDLGKVNYMINMDMVGRLNDSARINVGGYGTSPYWGQLFSSISDKKLLLKFDSSGTGPSDHTSFYRKDIPVLFFFTGTHGDYHKPSDDADKINFMGEYTVVKFIYKVIETANNNKSKLAFTKTREQQVVRSSFSVSLGIMPDYTYSGSGVRVDGVSEGKLAQKLGIKAGDIITQLGDFKFTDVSSYMQALGKFKKGDQTKVKLKRGNEELEYDVTF